jgi:hypothetical protein
MNMWGFAPLVAIEEKSVRANNQYPWHALNLAQAPCDFYRIAPNTC